MTKEPVPRREPDIIIWAWGFAILAGEPDYPLPSADGVSQ
jgi:hypothetical protein